MIRGPQARAQQRVPAEDIQRQITIIPVVAMKEPPLLPPIQRIVRGVQIQNDLRRRFRVGFQKHLHQQPVHRRLIHARSSCTVPSPPPSLSSAPNDSACSCPPALCPDPAPAPGSLPSDLPSPPAPPAADPAAARRDRSNPRIPAPTRTPAAPPTPRTVCSIRSASRWSLKAGRKPLHDPRPLLHLPQQQPTAVAA